MPRPQLPNRTSESVRDRLLRVVIAREPVDNPGESDLVNADCFRDSTLAQADFEERDLEGEIPGHMRRSNLYRTTMTLSSPYATGSMEHVEQTGPNDPYGLRAIVDTWRDQLPGRRPSYDDIAFRARDFGAPNGFVGSWLSKIFTGARPYDETLLAAIAEALEHEPEELPHYRLALTRRLLDERANGLEGALEVLTLVEGALREMAGQHLAKAAEHSGNTGPRLRATRNGETTPSAGRGRKPGADRRA